MILVKCPLCKSNPVWDGDFVSCSNGNCILHEGYQGETNRRLLIENWPSGDDMSIADIQNQFKTAVDGKVILVRATMDYAKGGQVQTFKFRVAKTNRGATHEIEVECRDYKDIPSIVKIAADSALTWVAANE